jgi:nicotinate-nucleotide adenylyltransferase
LNQKGLFGGTFDPIHLGHLRVARDVKKAFSLSEMIFIPTLLPPHKKRSDMADAGDRLEMVRLAIGDEIGFSISDIEIRRAGFSYTIDTVRHFLKDQGNHTRFYLVMGLDAFLEMDTWKSYMELFRLISIVVVARKGDYLTKTANWTTVAEAFLKGTISDKYRYDSSSAVFLHPDLQPVHLYLTQPVNVSSTMIRGMLRSGENLADAVPPGIEEFIQHRGLYR